MWLHPELQDLELILWNKKNKAVLPLTPDDNPIVILHCNFGQLGLYKNDNIQSRVRELKRLEN